MDSASRVNYYSGQFLRSQDFIDEQAYHLAKHRRHLIAHHIWGIVRGLELVLDDGAVFVQPGIAIDGYGRELLVAERLPLPKDVFNQLGSDAVDVFLYYGRVQSDPPLPGYSDCEPENCDPLAPQTGNANLAQERVYLRLFRANPELEPRFPPDVSPNNRDFNPAQTPPDDPAETWGVYVGQLRRDAQGKVSVLLANRPYAGLVGEFIDTPSRAARVQIGVPANDPQKPDAQQFAVFLRLDADESQPPQPQMTIVSNPVVDSEKKLHVETTVDLHGETTIYGDVRVVGGALGIDDEQVVSVTDNEPQQSWRVYRRLVQVPAQQGNGPTTIDTHEMRIEMPEDGTSQVVIGTWSAKEKKFIPCLTVTNQCEVIVNGKLIAKDFLKPSDTTNQSLEMAIGASAPLVPYFVQAGRTAEAQAFITGAYMSGVSGAIYRPYAVNRMAASPRNPVTVSAESLAAILANHDAASLGDIVTQVLNDRPDLTERARILRDKLPTRPRRQSGKQK